MEILDLIVYGILVLAFFFVLYLESKHFICDSLSCSMYQWSLQGISTDKDLYKNLLDGQTRQSVWMRSYMISLIIISIVYWWFAKELPRAIEFLSLLAIIFFVVYFGLVFYQHHFLAPINRDIKGYMDASCEDLDGRQRD